MTRTGHGAVVLCLAGMCALIVALPLWFGYAAPARGAQEARAQSAAAQQGAQAPPPAPQPAAAFSATLAVYEDELGKIVPMDLEEYVFCVVAGETPASFNAEALRAQAVAARTLCLYKAAAFGGKGDSRHKGADVCTDSGHCQAFRSPGQIAAMPRDVQQKLRDAVSSTAGQVITYDGRLIEVFYHATSGGMTEDSRTVFAIDEPYLRPVLSPGEEGAPKFEADVTLSLDAAAKLINRQYPAAKVSAKTLEQSVRVLSRTSAGRVDELRLGATTIAGTAARKLFQLNSANFTVGFSRSSLTFHTIGYGHGVGMSQTGANAMALNGSTYRDILAHYYQGTAVEAFRPDMKR